MFGSHESKLACSKHKVLNLSSCVPGREKPSNYLAVMDVRVFGVALRRQVQELFNVSRLCSFAAKIIDVVLGYKLKTL